MAALGMPDKRLARGSRDGNRDAPSILQPQPLALPTGQRKGGLVDIRVIVAPLMARHGVAQGYAIAAIEEKSEIGAGEQRDAGRLGRDQPGQAPG